jgi:hypothetical protein
VTIDRRFGFSQRLELTVKNLPAGILLEKAYSESKGDTAKAVNLKLSAAADASAFQGPIQLLATPVDDVGKPTGESTLVGFNLRPLVTLDTIWLSVAVDK